MPHGVTSCKACSSARTGTENIASACTGNEAQQLGCEPEKQAAAALLKTMPSRQNRPIHRSVKTMHVSGAQDLADWALGRPCPIAQPLPTVPSCPKRATDLFQITAACTISCFVASWPTYVDTHLRARPPNNPRGPSTVDVRATLSPPNLSAFFMPGIDFCGREKHHVLGDAARDM
jgi:hypothetical protein